MSASSLSSAIFYVVKIKEQNGRSKLRTNPMSSVRPVGVYTLIGGVGRSKRPTADVGDHVYRAERSSYAGASARFEHTVCDALSARFDGVGAVPGAAGAVGQLMSDGCYGCPGRSGHAGATWRNKLAFRDDWNTGAGTARAAYGTTGTGWSKKTRPLYIFPNI